jgi:hypothetical protein
LFLRHGCDRAEIRKAAFTPKAEPKKKNWGRVWNKRAAEDDFEKGPQVCGRCRRSFVVMSLMLRLLPAAGHLSADRKNSELIYFNSMIVAMRMQANHLIFRGWWQSSFKNRP